PDSGAAPNILAKVDHKATSESFLEHLATDMKSAAPFEIGGFNLDNILNLMAGDTQGNVDFGAIGIEVAQNLANVIDMNEVGNMATALGMMMSGIGVATEMQRQNSENRNAPNKDQNTIINSGVAALLQQVLSNSQESADTIPGQGSENIFNAIGSNNLNAAQLVNLSMHLET
ncbi:hypothetical protein LPJ57_004985, partial [Coemansia sp. RSA 486]